MDTKTIVLKTMDGVAYFERPEDLKCPYTLDLNVWENSDNSDSENLTVLIDF